VAGWGAHLFGIQTYSLQEHPSFELYLPQQHLNQSGRTHHTHFSLFCMYCRYEANITHK
jgi:hypothetical protein